MSPWRSFLIVVLLLVSWPLAAGELPTRPLLRLETGMHTAVINGIAVDRGERWLVTASHDKTARVWDLQTGALLTILRPPIGDDANEGKLFAVAISPDGETVAVGGWTDEHNSLYLFDRASGRLVHRLTGLPNVIFHLTFSADGHYLAAILGQDNGLRIYRTGEWTEVFADREYGDRSNGADFAADGRLVTSGYDGYVRLYDARFKLLAKVKPPGGSQPFGVAFSPDGQKIAVGFVDSHAVNLLSGTNLTLLSAPDTTGVNNGALSSVAWSQDGQWLYAAGDHQNAGKRLIRRWADGGRGRYQDFPVADDTLLDLKPLRGGRLAFGAGGPAWGVMDAQGRINPQHTPAQADLRGKGTELHLSSDGLRISFGMEYGGKRPVRFDLASCSLTGLAQPDQTLTAPRLQAQGLKITDWEDTVRPKLNGQPLKLENDETSRSLAITPGGAGFLLGTNWFLRRFDWQGYQSWQQPVPGIPWVVNISGDGRLAVAGYGDGTVRWQRMEDGKEILALFVHGDGKRWVAWTPEGYYMASPGGEELMGWQLNQGKEKEANFYPSSRFREQFARPDVVARVLETLDPREALRLADADRGHKTQVVQVEDVLPPVVHVLSPSDGAEFSTAQLTLRYQIDTRADAPITGLRPLIDGRPLEGARGLQRITHGDSEEITLTLPEHDLTVALIAENRHGSSEPAQLRLKWRGQAKPDEFVIKPKLYLLAIGESQYRNESMRLRFPAKDAQDFANVMRKQEGKLYRQVEAKVLPDATEKEIREGLEWLEKETTAKDVAMLFLAGHGENDRSGNYYFIPSDADPDKLKSTAIGYAMIKDTLSNLPGKVLAFFETRHSGNVMGDSRTRGGGVDVDRIANDLVAAENGVVVFTSSTGKQLSMESSSWNNGAFTKALVEGLDGKADYSRNGQITINKLDLYLAERVKELTSGQQTPTSARPKTTSDYAIAVVQ